MRDWLRFTGIVTVVLTGLLAMAAPLLKAGDRLVFMGDDITQQQVYTRYVMNYMALRYPGTAIAFRNTGTWGDTAPYALSRLQSPASQVMALKPTVVSLCYGMADGGWLPYTQEVYDRFLTGLGGMITEFKKNNIRMVILTPGWVDPAQNARLKSENGDYNATLAKFAEGVKALALKENIPCFDLHALMQEVVTRARTAEPAFTLTTDGVHPNNMGQALMAYALLQALGCTEKGSSLQIDAVTGKAKTDGCTVDEVTVASARSVKFTRTDLNLPVWLDADVLPLEKYFPALADLYGYRLKVIGLRAPTWKITVNGTELGNFTNTALAEGINLATLPGPWQELGKAINQRSTEDQTYYFSSWYYLGTAAPGLFPKEADAELAALQKKILAVLEARDLERQQLAANHAWKWALTAGN